MNSLTNIAHPITLITGAAGTGKTTLIKQITDSLVAKDIQVVLLAPTGRAAKVLRERTGHEASTIHRHIYATVGLPEHKDEFGNKNTFKWLFALNNNNDDADTVYIVDEASMISDSYSEEERFLFGSGYLLSDLMKFVDLMATNNRRRVVFVGDPYQLPPVNSSISPALCSEYLKHKFDVQAVRHNLTEVFRQAKGSGILENATKLREAIEIRNFTSFKIEPNSDVTVADHQEFMTLHQEVAKKEGIEKTNIVVYSNQSALEYNVEVRRWLFPGEPTVQAGDLLQVVRNAYNVGQKESDLQGRDLFNGDLVRVIKVSDHLQRQVAPLGKGRPTMALHFRNAVVQPLGENTSLEVMLIDDLLNSAERSLTDEQSDALYVNFKIRHPELRPGTKEFIAAYRNDPFVNALCVKYGYAMTCHKAQGGEWESVFVDYSYSSGRKESFFRWAYTATTRAKGKLFARQGVGINVFSKFKRSDVAGWGTSADTGSESRTLTESELIQLFADAGVILTKIENFDYNRAIYFNIGTESGKANIYFNKNNLITKYMISLLEGERLPEIVPPMLDGLKGRKIALESGKGIDVSASEAVVSDIQNRLNSQAGTVIENKMQLSIVTAITELLAGVGIRAVVTKIASQYNVHLKIIRGSEFVDVSCYSDSYGFMTKLLPMENKNASYELYETLQQLCLEVQNEN